MVNSRVIHALLINLGGSATWGFCLDSHLLAAVFSIRRIHNWDIPLVRLLDLVMVHSGSEVSLLNVFNLWSFVFLQRVLPGLGLNILILLRRHVDWSSLHVCVLRRWQIRLLRGSSRAVPTGAISGNAGFSLSKRCDMVVFISFCCIPIIAT